MFAAKTRYLLMELERYVYAGKRVLYINSALDTRSNTAISTNSKYLNGNVSHSCIKTDDLLDVDVSEYDVIGIDEAQFQRNLYTFCLLHERDKIIIVVGLDGDYTRKPMGQVMDIIPLADDYGKLYAVCACGESAIHTCKKISKANDKTLDIGGADKYMPVCRKCYYNVTMT